MTIQLPPIPCSISEAIAREEGYYVANTRASRNHNPGNIEFSAFSRIYGGTKGDPRFAIFPDDLHGFSCLKSLLMEHYKGLTISEAISKWAPGIENNTRAYISNVCAWTELMPDTIIDEHI